MSASARPLIQYDFANALLPETGISRQELHQLGPRLIQVRREMLDEDLALLERPDSIPPAKQPLDAAFLELPEQLLREYAAARDGSLLQRLFAAGARLRELVDRVAVLGIGGSYMGARALMEACCQPYFNELSRGERGSAPRMYFEGNNLDNDALRGLLHLLGDSPCAANPEDRWAIVVISKSGGTLETAVAFRLFLEALQNKCDGDRALVRQLIVPVTGEQGKLRDLVTAIGCPEVFPVPDGVGGRFSIFSAVGLLPAAILNIDVMNLLQGAAAMNAHFRSAPPGENVVLDFVAVNHLMEVRRGATIRVLSVWSKALECVGSWYDQLLAESLGKRGQGATPIAAVNTRDLHSRAQQHQQGRRDKMHHNVVVSRWREDPLAVPRSDWNQDGLNTLAGKGIPELMSAAVEGTKAAYRSGGRPSADILLPRVDEASLGQLFQMLMLATVVEGRLLGINPYGQPGVEAYKQQMQRILGEPRP